MSALIGSLLSPLGLLTVGLVLLALRGRRPRWQTLAWTLIALAMACTTAPVARALFMPLENSAIEIAEETRPSTGARFDAIVLLGGTVRAVPLDTPPDADREPRLAAGAERVLYAARLYREGLAPRIVVTGGRFDGRERESEAESMYRVLRLLGVPASAIVLEKEARNTRGNAALCARLLPDPSRTIALVTSAYHMPRAFEEFRLAGFRVSAFPTDWRQIPDHAKPAHGFLPSLRAMTLSTIALHEFLGHLELMVHRALAR